ncbi:MAG: 16S rRNA (cytosine(1402)-N(4))-methyltransferase RsmH [Sulfurovum sp.]|nr:16S rRNA (cytosine(1402)-N(4))-methyltransferase RsmH [Sulfurovum sp.]
MTTTPHIPVLLDSVLESFERCNNGYIIDCTLGYAGHSSALLKHLDQISIVGIDRDDEALSFSDKRLQNYKDRYMLYKGSFAQVLTELTEKPIVGVLADFGVSSLQLDKKDRGFSFESDTLDMRMDQCASLTAYDVVNEYTAKQLSYVFKQYGEIIQADRLADEIVKARTSSPIKSAKELSNIAKKVLYSGGKIHAATLMFQAIRIEVNDELGQIEGLLDAIEKMKPKSAIISLITFHSLEDRLVKHRFKVWSKECICDPSAPRCTCGKNHGLGKVLRRKPTTASQKELTINPRSRSAKLRSFQFKESLS